MYQKQLKLQYSFAKKSTSVSVFLQTFTLSPTKCRPTGLSVAYISEKIVFLPILWEHGMLSGETKVDMGLLVTISSNILVSRCHRNLGNTKAQVI